MSIAAAKTKSPPAPKWPVRFGLSALVAFLLAYTVLFVGPVDVVCCNQAYLSFSAGPLVAPLLGLTIAFTIVPAALVSLLRGRAWMGALAALFALALMCYLQGLLLDGRMASLDGSTFRWQDDPGSAWTNLLIWLGAVALCTALGLLFPETGRVVIAVACVSCVFGQTVGLVSTIPSDSASEYQLDGELEMTLSSGDNIVLFTLDRMSALIFETNLRYDSELGDFLKDFEFYNNMCGEYHLTFPSLAYLATHVHYDGTQLTADYFHDAWNSDLCTNFYDTLHELGYDVRFYMEPSYISLTADNMLGKVDNVAKSGTLTLTTGFLDKLFSISLYRYVPVMLKNGFCIATADLAAEVRYDALEPVVTNGYFYDTVRSGLTLQSDTNSFVWYHLEGAHSPFTIGWDGSFLEEEPEEVTISVRVSQLHGYLLMIEEYIQQMKDLGIYDNATIIISADHGHYDCFMPAFLIKPAGQTGDALTINEAPVTQQEVMPTILSLLGRDYSDYGTTIYDWSEGDEREREIRFWRHMDEYPEASFIGDFDQFDVVENGFTRFNVMCLERFTGGRDELMEVMNDWFYDAVADEITPIADSFY